MVLAGFGAKDYGAAVISAKNLTKRYGPRVAVDSLAFEVGRGEIVGFLGPNGAGKSTTLRMLTGFLVPSAGSVTVDGIDVHDEPEKARAKFGYMPESVPLHPELRVHEYLGYRAALKGVGRKGIAHEIDRCLDLAGVFEAKDRIIGQLSKGTRQRVGVADALLADPPLLVLDEPTSGLDPNQMRHVRELVRSFAGKKTVFLSTHILPEVEASCERVIIVRSGMKVAEGTMSELRARATGETRLVLDVNGSLDAAKTALEGESAVSRAAVDTSDAGRPKLVLSLAHGDAAVDSVFAAIVREGIALREMRREQSSLEDLFAELTQTETASPADAETTGASA